MSGNVPRPVTVNDELVAAVVGRLDELIGLIRDRLPAPTGGQPVLAGTEEPVRLDLTEPAQPGSAGSTEASTPDGGGLALTEPKPRKAARKATKRTSAKEQ
jgi:hypothetical protein